MGLPGSGKTMLSESLKEYLEHQGWKVCHLNADAVRTQAEDWDFSEQGRMRQAQRMRSLGQDSDADLVIWDMVAALPQQRNILDPDYVVWVDTMPCSRYADTDRVFQSPVTSDVIVTTKNRSHWAPEIAKRLFAK